MSGLQVVNKLVCLALVIGGGHAIARSVQGTTFFLRGIGSKQVGQGVPTWLGRPILFLLGIAALALAYGVWRREG